MKNDEPTTRRAKAIAEDRCFSKGRLHDEFRMKLAPGAMLVKWDSCLMNCATFICVTAKSQTIPWTIGSFTHSV